jgi:hypothetical protein
MTGYLNLMQINVKYFSRLEKTQSATYFLDIMALLLHMDRQGVEKHSPCMDLMCSMMKHKGLYQGLLNKFSNMSKGAKLILTLKSNAACWRSIKKIFEIFLENV